MTGSKRTLLLLIDLIAICLVIVTFSPLVTPANESNPSFYGIPFTLWASFLISALFVGLAYLVSLVNKEKNNAD